MTYPIKFSFWNILTMVNFYLRLDKGEGVMFGPFLCSKSPRSHRGDSEKAIDFLCKSGTEVVAVEDGQIIKLQDSFKGHGIVHEYQEKVNYIVIEHSNGEMSYYLHLRKDSIKNRRLDIGYNVRKGQVIGCVDNNGYMIYDPKKGPLTHLHFELRKMSGSKYTSKTPKFEENIFDKIKKIIVLFFLKCRS